MDHQKPTLLLIFGTLSIGGCGVGLAIVRTQNKPCWNSKAMGIHLAHNIRILKIKFKKKNLRPDLAPLNLLFFQCPFAASGRGAPQILPRPFPSGSK
jgi:hypothetical protein